MALEAGRAPPLYGERSSAQEASASAISWGAIMGGAFAAASLSLVMAVLGSGFGLSAVSVSASEGATATTLGVAAIIWLIVMQWFSAGVGGYIAGRLRTKWSGLHVDESFFRDTAHGFLAWAVATVVTVGLLASAASSAIGTGVQAAASVGAGAARGATEGAANVAGSAISSGYDLDALFRRAQPDANAPSADTQAEAGRILARGIANGDVPEADRAYLAQVIAARAGISAQDARQRVDATVAQAREAADKAKAAAEAARKATAKLAIFTALSMLIGAFIASAAAGWGGRLRDE